MYVSQSLGEIVANHVDTAALTVDANGATFCSSARGRTVYSTTEEQRHDVQRQSQVHLRLSRG